MADPVIATSAPSYLDALNDPQRRAVETLQGPLLVLAGAGTGKTRVVTARLAHLIATRTAWPSQIFAVTFTNKAAQEMKNRVANLLGQPVEGWWLGTFHSLAARILRRNAERVGLTSSFTILDDDDQVRLVKQIMEAESIDTKKNPPSFVHTLISRFKDRALKPSDLTFNDTGDMVGGRLAGIYATYQARLKTLNACDFGDLILHLITLLRDPAHADLLESLHRQFRYIFVDEYQDTNVAQYLWLRLMAKGHNNICCVGDDDQSIYGWRGAEVGNILRFEKDFPGAAVIRLEENYRSTDIILQAADGLIAHNRSRLGKTLWSTRKDGTPITVCGAWDGDAEARYVAEQIDLLRAARFEARDVAVLVRAGFQMRAFEERFMQEHIPYKVVGGPRFFERAEIRDALAYLRVVAQPADDLALERIVNLPKRGIGGTTLDGLRASAREQNVSLHDAIHGAMAAGVLKGKAKDGLQSFMADLARWQTLRDGTPHMDLAAQILDESGYLSMWRADPAPDAPGRLDNLKEFVSSLADFESLEAFLEHVALVFDRQDNADDNAVTLMTLHAAKGLEYRAVFLTGWEEGLFPSQRSMDENGAAGLEEERRLAYVGITRARERCFITHAANRRTYGQWVNAIPSRFIDELPANAVSIAGMAVGAQQSAQPSWMMQAAKRDADPGHDLSRGDAVNHPRFGDGVVIAVDGNKCDVQFEDGSHQRIIASFLERID